MRSCGPNSLAEADLESVRKQGNTQASLKAALSFTEVISLPTLEEAEVNLPEDLASLKMA